MTDKVPYLSKSDIEELPDGTVITAMDIPDSGTWWMTTSDKDFLKDAGDRRFFPLCTGENKLHSYQQELLDRIAAGETVPIIAPTGRAAKTIHSMLYGENGTITGRTAHVIIDDDIPPTSLDAWGDKLWSADLAALEERYIQDLFRPDTGDDWRKLYMCEWPDPLPEPTEKEKKAAHRETYLRHNKVKGKFRDPHARRSRPF